MDETQNSTFIGHLEIVPQAQQSSPRTSSSPTQIPFFQPLQMQMYYPILPFYNEPMCHQYQWLPSSSPPPLPPPTLPPRSPTPTRTLLLCSVPTHVNETTVRSELQVFGELRSVEMDRLQDGIVTVHFYDVRHSQAALMEIQEQHIQQQLRVRLHYTVLGSENFPPPLPPLVPGLIAGWAIWAQFSVPGIFSGFNQGTIMVLNLDSKVSSRTVKDMFEAFGPVKELRRVPLKMHQWFVEFFDIRVAAKALSGLNGKIIHGKHLMIVFSNPPPPGGHGRRTNNNDPKPPTSLPSWLLDGSTDSTSNTLPCHHPSQTKKSGFGGNRSKGDREHCNNSSATTTTTSSATKQSRSSKTWKRRHERSESSDDDTNFLINEEAIMESDIRDTRTTVMIKNIPNRYTQKQLLEMLDNHCIRCNDQIANSDGDGNGQPLSSYDFVYLPIDFNNKCNVGYGFVNFTSTQAIPRLYKAFHMKPWDLFNSKKIGQVSYARIQGLEALKEHFKNIAFQGELEEYLPVVFSPPRDGKQLTNL